MENKQAPVSAFSGYLLDSITFDSIPNHKKRLKKLIIGGSIAYTAAMTGLYFVWYKDGQQTNFHFFDDSGEWRQIDKVGHFYSAFHIARSSAEAFRWAGMQEKKAMFWGAMTGIMLMTPIEILDGFSSEYGASWSDFAANTGGALFAFGQFALWNEIRIHPKFSFHRTSLAAQRPAVLGQGLQEELIKDYNGQTYWLSFDLDKFFPESSRFPKWLNLGLGYGAQDMIYAETQQNEALTGLKSYRQYYLGVDFDLNAIPARRKFWKTTLYILNLIHLPAPALEYNAQNGFKFRPFYF
ncbi:MAG: DUF2279 domain-containing protein [Microscillaceae bacterium]|nr:DUF2279 domain-containing protein [Microscillaceae bacterium]